MNKGDVTEIVIIIATILLSVHIAFLIYDDMINLCYQCCWDEFDSRGGVDCSTVTGGASCDCSMFEHIPNYEDGRP